MRETTMRIDLHAHSANSPDGFDTIDSLRASAKKRGLNGIAATDHNKITLAHSEMRKGMFLLQGVEASTKQGHMLVYNYSGKLHTDAFELVEKVRDENGITVVAHPFGMRKDCLRENTFRVKADGIERFNGRSLVSNLACVLNRFAGVGGSDAHIKEEVGNAYTEFGDCEKIEDIWGCLRKGKFSAKWETKVGTVALAKWKKIKKMLK